MLHWFINFSHVATVGLDPCFMKVEDFRKFSKGECLWPVRVLFTARAYYREQRHERERNIREVDCLREVDFTETIFSGRKDYYL
jgi:hypothetical protein